MPTKRPAKKHFHPRRPVGRPKTQDLAALEARLVLVASHFFFESGYGATSVSAIARAARVSKNTLYARFPSKAALFQAIVAAQIEAWDTGVHRTVMADYDTLEKALLAYGEIALRAGLTDEFIRVNRLTYSESGRFPELGKIAHRRFLRGVHDVAEQIRTFAEREGIPCRNPDAAAEHFLSTLLGWCNMAVVSNRIVKPKERRAWLQQAVRIFLSGRSAW